MILTLTMISLPHSLPVPRSWAPRLLLGGLVFLLSHTSVKDKHDKAGDMNPSRALTKYGAEVLLHGHTHKYKLMESMDGLVVICPGHIKNDNDRGSSPTFAIMAVPSSRIEAS